MNGFNPKATVLIKLAQFIYKATTDPGDPLADDLSVLLDDPEILEWYDRMAELEYVPKRPEALTKVVITNIPPGQTAALSLLDAEEDRIECGAVISESIKPEPQLMKALDTLLKDTKYVTHENLQSFQLCCGTEATSAFCSSIDAALKRCLQEFPKEEGHVGHHVINVDTGVVTYLDSPKPVPLSLED